jgi:hypothetical protein
MTSYNAPFEIHVHGEVLLRDDVDFKALQEATKPLWKYAGARSLTEGAQSLYEEEPGLRFEAADHKLQICWTVKGDDDFRQVLDDLCMNINEVSAAGAQLEITFTTPNLTMKKSHVVPSHATISSFCSLAPILPPSCKRSVTCSFKTL